MKFKATKKEMKENYSQIAKIGYCNAQFLLKFEEPKAYSTRAEGWACDYYDIEGVLISTGYAPLESRNTDCTYDSVRIYDEQAEKIICDYSLKYEDQKAKVTELLHEFITEIKK